MILARLLELVGLSRCPSCRRWYRDRYLSCQPCWERRTGQRSARPYVRSALARLALMPDPPTPTPTRRFRRHSSRSASGAVCAPPMAPGSPPADR